MTELLQVDSCYYLRAQNSHLVSRPSISYQSLTASEWLLLKKSPGKIFIETNRVDERTSWFEILREPPLGHFLLCDGVIFFQMMLKVFL